MKKIILSLLTSVLLTACGSVNVVTQPGQSINPNSKITGVTPSDDPRSVAGQLEFLLIQQGFEVFSEAASTNRTEYTSEVNFNQDQITSEGIVDEFKTVPTDLIIRFSYSSYYDAFYWSFTRFNATVVTLSSGKIVAAINFSGDRSINSVLEDFTKQIGNMKAL